MWLVMLASTHPNTAPSFSMHQIIERNDDNNDNNNNNTGDDDDDDDGIDI